MSQASSAAACPYCRTPMLAAVGGWHCPACHATLGASPRGRPSRLPPGQDHGGTAAGRGDQADTE